MCSCSRGQDLRVKHPETQFRACWENLTFSGSKMDVATLEHRRALGVWEPFKRFGHGPCLISVWVSREIRINAIWNFIVYDDEMEIYLSGRTSYTVHKFAARPRIPEFLFRRLVVYSLEVSVHSSLDRFQGCDITFKCNDALKQILFGYQKLG